MPDDSIVSGWHLDWHLITFILSTLGVVFFTFIWCAFFLVIWFSFKHLHKPLKKTLPSYPPVSILKPLTGGGHRIEHNLESFFQLSYPKFELLICVSDPSDPAITSVNYLIRRYPHVDATLFVTGGKNEPPKYSNPKIENLLPGYNAAKYGAILIADCSVRADSEMLIDLVSEYVADERNGIVWQIPAACTQGRRTMGAAVHQVYFSAITSKSHIFIDIVNQAGALGSSLMFRREAMEQCGGLAAFGKYLAEDYFISQAVAKKGWKIRLTTRPAWHNPSAVPDMNLKSLYFRLLRWKRLRQMMFPVVEFIAPWTECLGLCIIGATSLHHLFGFDIWLVASVHILFFYCMDWILLRRIFRGRKMISFGQFFLAWITLQAIQVAIHLVGPFSRQVVWRNRLFKIQMGGEAVPVDDKPIMKASVSLHDVTSIV